MVKELADGARAVGLCNRGEIDESVTAAWTAIGVSGRHRIRDLWRQKNLGSFGREFKAAVPRHGVVLVRVEP
jgi:alpha-galactosidase